MEINNMLQQNIYSLRQAINYSNLKKAMHQDAISVANLLSSVEKTSAMIMENAVTPHKGSNIDVRI